MPATQKHTSHNALARAFTRFDTHSVRTCCRDCCLFCRRCLGAATVVLVPYRVVLVNSQFSLAAAHTVFTAFQRVLLLLATLSTVGASASRPIASHGRTHRYSVTAVAAPALALTVRSPPFDPYVPAQCPTALRMTALHSFCTARLRTALPCLRTAAVPLFLITKTFLPRSPKHTYPRSSNFFLSMFLYHRH